MGEPGASAPERDWPVGRELELPRVERFLASGAQAPTLVLFGEPGIGRTTVWEAAVRLARERGYRALCARASDSVGRLSFAGLADLLVDVEQPAFERLPAAQQFALGVALHRVVSREANGPEPLAIAAGFLELLRPLAMSAPLLVAIDDAVALDPASAEVIVFAARRLRDLNVRFLLTRPAGRQSELEHALEAGALQRLRVGALSLGAINRLLTERLDVSLPRWVVRQLFETTGGNPLLALEFGRTVVEQGVAGIGEPLPTPPLPGDLFEARVARLSPAARRVLLLVGLGDGLSRAQLETLADPVALDDALATELISVDGQRVRVSHLLIVAAACERASAADRREVHEALAGVASDPVLRAHHMALTAPGPDEQLADEVGAAATTAGAGGAVLDAVALATRALELTPADAPQWPERLLELCRWLVTAGDRQRAWTLLSDELEQLPPGRLRASAHLLLGDAAPLLALEEQHLEQAIAEDPADPELRAEALARQSVLLSIMRVERLAESERLASESLAVAAVAGAQVECQALTALAWARALRGKPIDDLLASQPRDSPRRLWDGSIDRPAGVQLAFRGELSQARSTLQGTLAAADARGEIASGLAFLVQLLEFEFRAGDLLAAAVLRDELEQWTAVAGDELAVVSARLGAVEAALRGDPDAVSRCVTVVRDLSGAVPGNQWDRLETARAEGIASLYMREGAQAVARLQEVWEQTIREGVEDPGAFPVAGDLVEALVLVGELAPARAVTERLARLSAEQAHPWGQATVKRCAALIALSEGYDVAMATALAGAAADYGQLGLGFDRARTLLVLGRLQRRFNKRADARQSLELAAVEFDALGCVGWADQAREELSRVSGRRPGARGDLTEGERRVAELAAAGRSNKEIAAELFLSVYTVEQHLSRSYAKLAIRSRSQLARRLKQPAQTSR